jgi:hypothetical protein
MGRARWAARLGYALAVGTHGPFSSPVARVRRKGLYARRIANDVERFQALEISRPNLSSPSRGARILTPPESTGRAHVRRPLRLSGAIERGALSAASWSQTPSIWCRLGSEHGYSVGRGPIEQQASGDALAVRDQGCRPGLARRRLQGGEVRTELSVAGFRKTTARSARTSSKRYQHYKFSGRGPGASHPSHTFSERSCEAAKPRAHKSLPLWGRCRRSRGRGE